MATATFLGLDHTTKGNWINVFGQDGYYITGYPVVNPSYATIAFTSGIEWSGGLVPGEVRDLQTPDGSNRAGSVIFQDSIGASVYFTLSITDSLPHILAVYQADIADAGRDQTLRVIDHATSTTLDSQRIGEFVNGVWAIWLVTGNVDFACDNHLAINSFINGLFLSSAVAAPFIGQDTTTQGTWIGVYGQDGYEIVGDGSLNPSYATIASSTATGLFIDGTTDVRAPQHSDASTRIAEVRFSNTEVLYTLSITDSVPHTLAVYIVDWEHGSRVQTMQIRNHATGAVLNSQSASAFDNGVWFVWTVYGNVDLAAVYVSGNNAVINAVCLSPQTQVSEGVIDSSIGSWTRQDDSTVGLFRKTNKSANNSAYYIKSAKYPSSDVFLMQLNHLMSPGVTTGHRLSYNYYNRSGTSQKPVTLLVELLQGTTTVIASWTHSNIGYGTFSATQTLTGTQVGNITDYTNLYLRFTASGY